eukprot:356550-Chlamydomonas_euryale.AAC.9
MQAGSPACGVRKHSRHRAACSDGLSHPYLSAVIRPVALPRASQPASLSSNIQHCTWPCDPDGSGVYACTHARVYARMHACTHACTHARAC